MVVLSRPSAFSPNDVLSDIRQIAGHFKAIFRPVETCCNEIQLAADRVRGQIAGLAAVTPGLLGMNASKHGRMIRVNRAPVLTLWATVVAERLGFDCDAALTLGRAVAGSSAQMKGRALGIYEPSEEAPSTAAEERREHLEPDEPLGVRLLGRTVPVIRTPDGIRAMEKDFRPASAASVEQYLASKFGDRLEEVWAAMEQLAASRSHRRS